MHEENNNFYVKNWLLLITLSLSIMIIIGGLTRLTDSGLSITKWDLFVGIIPPFTLGQWNEAFSLYKETSEYKIQNFSMNLQEFKIIFWWEYIHRLLGRFIGLIYIIPLIFFTFKKIIKSKLLITLYFIFFLICLQGFIGWYMVQSGLINNTDVSHYRLSLHLTLAFIILALVFWNYLKFTNLNNFASSYKRLPMHLPLLFFILVLVQISFGAFVSGLDAGQIYNTWPLMNGAYFPNDSNLNDLFSIKFLNETSLVQFVHRNIAYFIFFFFLHIIVTIYKNKNFLYLRKISLIILCILLIQIFLGIFTVLSKAQIILASLHQLGSIILLLSSVILIFKNHRKIN